MNDYEFTTHTYFRYALPTIFAMPVMISMFFKIIRNGK